MAAAAADMAGTNTLYPIEFRDAGGFAHHPIAHAVLAGPDHAELLKSFCAFLMDHRENNIIASSEAFTNCISTTYFGRLYRFLSSVAPTHRLRLVICLRSIESFIESMYLHSVKAGEITVDVDEYVSKRWKWASGLFWALEKLDKSDIGELVCVKYEQEPGFDAKLVGTLGIEDRDVVLSKLQARNKRLGIKAQTFFRFLDVLKEEYSCEFRRWPLIRAFEVGQVAFDEEEHCYSVLKPDVRYKLRASALSSAELRGFVPYTSFFSTDQLQEIPFRRIVRTNLCDRDIQLIIEFQNRAIRKRRHKRRTGKTGVDAVRRL